MHEYFIDSNAQTFNLALYQIMYCNFRKLVIPTIEVSKT